MITEYRGLDVGQMAELRSALREAETVYKIYKNTLVRRALDEGIPSGLVDLLVGPTALAFVEKDPGAAAKALKDFSAANDALIIKGALLNGELLDEAQVRELADLPSRDELLSSIAGGLAAPLQQIASMMNNLLSEMANLLQALADKSGDLPEAAQKFLNQSQSLSLRLLQRKFLSQSQSSRLLQRKFLSQSQSLRLLQGSCRARPEARPEPEPQSQSLRLLQRKFLNQSQSQSQS